MRQFDSSNSVKMTFDIEGYPLTMLKQAPRFLRVGYNNVKAVGKISQYGL